jgi:hypothetical protein
MDKRNYSSDSLISTRELFYDHPCLAIGVEDYTISFYPMTSKHHEISEKRNITLSTGTSSEDAGPNVLRLSLDSGRMPKSTLISLQQRYYCKLEELYYWTHEVQIDPTDLDKLDRHITELEAAQNRFIYMPL